ncbi:MAG TPA: ABC transporter permease subunit [Ktedonobacterales bacterium]|nr:ABC transporter permease subunit [Ktedonobacterales bacterium]
MSDQTLKASAGALPKTGIVSRADEREGAKTLSLSRRRRSGPVVFLIYLFLIVMTIFSLFPIYFVLQASLRGNQTLYTTDLQLFPTHPTLDNYSFVLTKLPFLNWVWNSIYVCGLATLIGLFCSTTAAYALARFRFHGRQITLVVLLAIQAFPSLLALLAYYLLLQTLGLINTLEGLAVVYAAQSVVFGAWNLKGYFDTLPVELEQAALVDGATPTQAFWRVTLPLAAPALATTALFSFIGGWNEFALANILLSSNGLGGESLGTNITFPVGIYSLTSDFRVPWGYFAAASVMVAIPIMILFFYLQRFFKSGLTIGSVKG